MTSWLPALLLTFATPGPSFELAIDLTALPAMPARQLQGMMREAEALWKPYGVLLIWITALPAPLDVLRTVRVIDECAFEQRCPPEAGDRDARAKSSPRLGAALFPKGQVNAEETIMMSVDAVARMVTATEWARRPVTDWPPAAREALIGRALGRVLAHEIGHYLLAWRSHTPDGLMQPRFSPAQLIEPGRRGLALPKLLVPRLRVRLAQLAAKGATVAEEQ